MSIFGFGRRKKKKENEVSYWKNRAERSEFALRKEINLNKQKDRAFKQIISRDLRNGGSEGGRQMAFRREHLKNNKKKK